MYYGERKIINGWEVCRIENDVNGNGRYVVHYLAFGENYNMALNAARRYGGKKYRAKWYGGGIVFQDGGSMTFTEGFRR